MSDVNGVVEVKSHYANDGPWPGHDRIRLFEVRVRALIFQTVFDELLENAFSAFTILFTAFDLFEHSHSVCVAIILSKLYNAQVSPFLIGIGQVSQVVKLFIGVTLNHFCSSLLIQNRPTEALWPPNVTSGPVGKKNVYFIHGNRRSTDKTCFSQVLTLSISKAQNTSFAIP